MSTSPDRTPPPVPPIADDGSRARPRHRGRALAAVAVVALLCGGGFVVAGLTTGDDDADVVLDVEDAIAPVPSTVAPVVTVAPPTTSMDDAADDPATLGDAGSTAPALSPLAELLGDQYSAVPEDVEPRPVPIGVVIDAIDLGGYPIRPVGLEPDGQLEVPDETEIGWYRYGATAGRPGATVLAAHVSWNGTAGPFAQLGSLDPGQRITVELDDGTAREYEVFERALYGKLELPRERIWRNTGPETLVLITCGGDFNPEIRRYRQNIVVYAAPVG